MGNVGVIEKFEKIEKELNRGEITLSAALERMRSLKNEYISEKSSVKNPEQSWHSFIGRKFQSLIFSALKGEIQKLRKEDKRFEKLCVLSEGELKKKKWLYDLLTIPYPDGKSEHHLLPDADIILAVCDQKNPKILAVISCKTSLRERIAQACYWKLKFLQFEKTRHIKVYLATTDNDGDFRINHGKKVNYKGKSRNRVIAETELDGIYIVSENFKEEWESEKVKRYDKMIEDIRKIIINETQTM